MASELSSYIDNELKKMEEQPENQRLLSALRVKVGTRDPADARLPLGSPTGAGPLLEAINAYIYLFPEFLVRSVDTACGSTLVCARWRSFH